MRFGRLASLPVPGDLVSVRTMSTVGIAACMFVDGPDDDAETFVGIMWEDGSYGVYDSDKVGEWIVILQPQVVDVLSVQSPTEETPGPTG